MPNDKAKLTFILEKIEDLESYISEYKNISNLLSNKLSQDAALMCLLQIGETLNKLQNSYKNLDEETIIGAYNVRNFIAHDYEGLNLAIIEDIIRNKIPELKEVINHILKSNK